MTRIAPAGAKETEPTAERTIDAFFYGLFMDVDLLAEKGAAPVNPRPASVEGFALRIGDRATLIPSHGARAFGMLISLTHHDLSRLYSGPGLEPYRPEAVMVKTVDGESVPALCYNLPEPPRPDERNPEYAARLKRPARRGPSARCASVPSALRSPAGPREATPRSTS